MYGSSREGWRIGAADTAVLTLRSKQGRLNAQDTAVPSLILEVCKIEQFRHSESSITVFFPGPDLRENLCPFLWLGSKRE